MHFRHLMNSIFKDSKR